MSYLAQVIGKEGSYATKSIVSGLGRQDLTTQDVAQAHEWETEEACQEFCDRWAKDAAKIGLSLRIEPVVKPA